MDTRKFSISNAVTHFLWTPGPRGFLLAFVLAYMVMSLASQALSLFFQAETYAIYVRVFTEGGGDIAPYVDEINEASMLGSLGSLVLLPVALLAWTVFEAASQRRYIHGEGFRLRVGADEGRLAVVALIWIALLIAGYIGLLIIVLVPFGIGALLGGVGVGGVLAGLFTLAGLIAMVWLFARLSPAGALTIRDQQIRFFEAWRVTRFCSGRLLASYLLLLLIIAVINIIVFGLLLVLGLAILSPVLSGSDVQADAVFAAMGQPGFWMPMALGGLVLTAIAAVVAHAFAGPAALAAKTDPDWSGVSGPAGAFL
ncbi:MAG: hypothetical protein ACK46Q_11615 [Hyphomonas sp.]